MKKFLMGTSALVGVTMLAGQAIAAEKPTVSVGGYLDFNMGAGSDNDAVAAQGFSTDAEVHVKASGKADNGLSYGAKIELEGSGATSADEAMMWVSGSWGKIELGNEDGAGGRMQGNVTTGTGTGGATDGDYGDYISLNGSIDSVGRSNAINGTADDVKIQYYNSFGAVNVGISYMPDTRSSYGVAANDATTDGYENVVEMGANWTGEVGNGAKVYLGASYAVGDAIGEGGGDHNEDYSGYGVTGKVMMNGWTVAAAYNDRGDAGDTTGSGTDEDSWSASVKYATGPWTIGAEYMEKDDGNDNWEGMSLGFTYSVAPGLYVGGEIVDIDQKVSGTSSDGQVVILTTGVSF